MTPLEWKEIEYTKKGKAFIRNGETKTKLSQFLQHSENLDNGLEIHGVFTWSNCCSDVIMLHPSGDAAIVGSYEQFKTCSKEYAQQLIDEM